MADDEGIATDKKALLPGATAGFANYTSYSRGLNGMMVDIPAQGSVPLALSDFEFRVGNNNTPGNWTPVNVAPSFSMRTGAGTAGTDRAIFTWPDGTIKNTWLQVTVKASAATGLAADDVYYFGNAIGESGNSAANAVVNSTDEVAARNNAKTFLSPASISDAYDFNRDRFVNATDQILARSNSTTLATALKLISVPGSLQAAAASSPSVLPVDNSIAIGLAAPVSRTAKLPTPSVSEIIPQLPPVGSAAEDHKTARRPLVESAAAAGHSASTDRELDMDEYLYDLIAADLVESRF